MELNNSARPINVTTHGRRCLAGFVREDLEVDGGMPGKLNVLFHRNVPEGLHIPTSQKSGPSRRYTPLVLCGLSRFLKLLPTISLRFLRQSLKFVKDSRCCQRHMRIRVDLNVAWELISGAKDGNSLVPTLNRHKINQTESKYILINYTKFINLNNQCIISNFVIKISSLIYLRVLLLHVTIFFNY